MTKKTEGSYTPDWPSIAEAIKASAGWECQNMLTVSLLIAQAAQQRRESRGTHFRRDFPNTDDKNFAKHIDLTR